MEATRLLCGMKKTKSGSELPNHVKTARLQDTKWRRGAAAQRLNGAKERKEER
jgi:hypothetical protein